MTKNIEHIIHKNSNVVDNNKPKLPEASVLEYGEIAVNYGKGAETISIKNSANEIVTFQNEVLVTDTEFKGDEKTTAEIIIDESENDEGIEIYTKEEVDAKFYEGPNTNGHEYVDLGLPSGLLWATCNVGASKPEDYGLYFQWGDTEGYTKEQIGTDKTFNLNNYKWWNSSEKYTKYNNFTQNGIVDKKKILDLEDDAAHVMMGGDWRMPTADEFSELYDNTVREYAENYNGSNKNVIIARGKGEYSDKFIILPVDGYAEETSLKEENMACFWSSSRDNIYTNFAISMKFSSLSLNNSARINLSRQLGFNIKGVIPNTLSEKYLPKTKAEEIYATKVELEEKLNDYSGCEELTEEDINEIFKSE